MCRVLDVSRAGFYRYLQRPNSARAKQRLQVKRTVEDTFKTYKARYGAPRIAKELNDMGIPCSKNHVALLLQESGLKARNGKNFKYRPATEAMTNVSENLLCRNFDAKRPNQKWVTDITYIWVKDKWLYLAAVMDLFSRAVVGWAIDTQMTDSLVIKAFEMATSNVRSPKT
jgi:putative transposase